MYFLTQGIDSDVEAFAAINDEHQIPIKRNGNPSNIDCNMVEGNLISLEGENKMPILLANDQEGNEI
ncbi:MAG: hypothetical protein R2852_05355 [Bacteroidia bacterium]